MTDTATNNTAADNTAATPTLATLFTLPIHFKNWALDSKGHKDLVALGAKGGIADFKKEVTESVNEDSKVAQFKRNSLSYNVTTLNMAFLLSGAVEAEALTPVMVDHIQELVNAAIKKEVQTMVSDIERTTPVSEADLPTFETVLSQPYNKRPSTIKVTVDMIKAAVTALIEFLTKSGVKEGGIKLTDSLCTKKFSIAALNTIDTPVIEKVQGLVLGWFETLTEAEQGVHFAVVDLWDKNIDAKLNPKQEDISIDMF